MVQIKELTNAKMVRSSQKVRSRQEQATLVKFVVPPSGGPCVTRENTRSHEKTRQKIFFRTRRCVWRWLFHRGRRKGRGRIHLIPSIERSTLDWKLTETLNLK